MEAFTSELLIISMFLLCFKGYQIRAANNCSWGNFQCNNKKCVKPTFRCDFDDDCGDNSDETGCGARCTNQNYFRCNNSNCISRMDMCQGDNDCGDNSDETPFLCGTGSAPLTCYHCDTKGSSSCRNTVECSRSRGYTRCARFEYKYNGSSIIESTCVTKSDCTPEGIAKQCNKRGEGCRMQCCAKNRCNQPSSFSNNTWSPELTCYKCNIHNWESCNTKVTCSGNEGYTRCYKMSYNRIEIGRELAVISTGCATLKNCSTTEGDNLCAGQSSNCNLQCCNTSSCNNPNIEKPSTKPNLKCFKCSSKKSFQDCNEQKVLETCKDSEDSCYTASVITDNKNDDAVPLMYYKGCTQASNCNSTTLEVCKKHLKSTSCKVKCCKENGCNAGSFLVVSWVFLMACALVYLSLIV